MARKIIIPRYRKQPHRWYKHLEPASESEEFPRAIIQDIINKLGEHPNVDRIQVRMAYSSAAAGVQFRLYHKGGNKKFVTCRAHLQWNQDEQLRIDMMVVGVGLSDVGIINPAAEAFYEKAIQWLTDVSAML
jgi:hypothetical protein